MKFAGQFINDKGEEVSWWFKGPSEEAIKKHIDEIGWEIVDMKEVEEIESTAPIRFMDFLANMWEVGDKATQAIITFLHTHSKSINIEASFIKMSGAFFFGAFLRIFIITMSVGGSGSNITHRLAMYGGGAKQSGGGGMSAGIASIAFSPILWGCICAAIILVFEIIMTNKQSSKEHADKLSKEAK